MTYYVAGIPYSPDDIYHHGIRGQKWGLRRFQNDDGSLTEEGKRRYGTSENFENYKQYKAAKSNYRWAKAANYATLPTGILSPFHLATMYNKNLRKAQYKEAKSNYEDSMKKATGRDLAKERKERGKVALKAAGVLAGAALATYGAYKLSQVIDKGDSEWLKTGRDNAELAISAIGKDKVSASIFEKTGNAIKYYTGHTNKRRSASMTKPVALLNAY